MTRYSTDPSDRIFVKSYGFLSFAKQAGKSFGKNITTILSAKYSQTFQCHGKKSAIDAFQKLLQKEQFKNQ